MDIHIYGNPASVPATVAATSDTVLSTKASGNTCASVSVISSAVMSPKVTADPSYSSLLSSVLAPAGPPFSLCATPSRGLFSDPEPVFGGEFLQEARARSVTVASSQAGISPPLLTPERQATPAPEAAAVVAPQSPEQVAAGSNVDTQNVQSNINEQEDNQPLDSTVPGTDDESDSSSVSSRHSGVIVETVVSTPGPPVAVTSLNPGPPSHRYMLNDEEIVHHFALHPSEEGSVYASGMYAQGHLTLPEASSLLTQMVRIRRILAIHAADLIVLRTQAIDEPNQQLEPDAFLRNQLYYMSGLKKQ